MQAFLLKASMGLLWNKCCSDCAILLINVMNCTGNHHHQYAVVSLPHVFFTFCVPSSETRFSASLETGQFPLVQGV